MAWTILSRLPYKRQGMKGFQWQIMAVPILDVAIAPMAELRKQKNKEFQPTRPLLRVSNPSETLNTNFSHWYPSLGQLSLMRPPTSRDFFPTTTSGDHFPFLFFSPLYSLFPTSLNLLTVLPPPIFCVGFLPLLPDASPFPFLLFNFTFLHASSAVLNSPCHSMPIGCFFLIYSFNSVHTFVY